MSMNKGGKTENSQLSSKPELNGLLSWIDSEIEYHSNQMESININFCDTEADAFNLHNEIHLHLTRLRSGIADMARYRWLRDRDIETINEGGVFAGQTPENIVINGKALDDEIDAAMLMQD